MEKCINLHQNGKILPDSYVVDVNSFVANATKIYEKASKKNIRLFFMLKQVGRNPYLAQKLVQIGYSGAVCVDFNEALLMMKHHIPLGNVGHLVQIPKQLLKKIMAYGCEVITVYSFEKLREIQTIAHELGIVQKIIVKVVHNHDILYSGQESGIHLDVLENFIVDVQTLPNIKIVGATAFPCFLYDNNQEKIVNTNNYHTVISAITIMKQFGLNIEIINLPSASSCEVIDLIDLENVVLEPGHALTGTTPAHVLEREETPAVIYISEVSHHYNGESYVYGGGHYRRSNIKHALINHTLINITPPNDAAIDYYFKVNGLHPISSTVVMSFRFQFFVCRSRVVLLENDEIVGEYTCLGELYE